MAVSHLLLVKTKAVVNNVPPIPGHPAPEPSLYTSTLLNTTSPHAVRSTRWRRDVAQVHHPDALGAPDACPRAIDKPPHPAKLPDRWIRELRQLRCRWRPSTTLSTATSAHVFKLEPTLNCRGNAVDHSSA